MTDAEVLEHEHFAEEASHVEARGDIQRHIWAGTCRCGALLQGQGSSAHDPSDVEWVEVPAAWTGKPEPDRADELAGGVICVFNERERLEQEFPGIKNRIAAFIRQYGDEKLDAAATRLAVYGRAADVVRGLKSTAKPERISRLEYEHRVAKADAQTAVETTRDMGGDA